MQVKCYLFCFLIAFTQPIFGQQQRITSFQQDRKETSPIDEIKFRNIGPTIMSGRVTDLEVNPDNVNEFYVAYASGGLFHTSNNGQSMEPIFDQEATITIGDIAVNWKQNLIWVGTGEEILHVLRMLVSVSIHQTTAVKHGYIKACQKVTISVKLFYIPIIQL